MKNFDTAGFMIDFAGTFSFPTEVIFGSGYISQLPAHLKKAGCKRPLLVTDKTLTRTCAFDTLTQGLYPLVKWSLFDRVLPNPVEENVREAANAFRRADCDCVIAFGGGSTLDVAKGCRLLVKRPELNLARFDREEDWNGIAPFIAIPSTAGTGSEVGRSSVITLSGTDRKSVIFLPQLLASLVILDPQLTLELPPHLTAATGLDALSHCIESFTSPVFHPLCDGIALEGINIIAKALPRAYQNGQDVDARGKMLVAAAMGGVAFQKDLGATHSLAHPLSSLCGMHHGTANAICLPHVMSFNAQRQPGLYRRVGVALGLPVMSVKDEQADKVTIEFLREFIAELGFKEGLRKYDVDETKLEALADQAFADSCHLTNPVSITREDLKSLYLASL